MKNLLKVLKPEQRRAPREGATNSLQEFCSAENMNDVQLYHYSVHYVRSLLIDTTDFVDQYGYEPSLLEVEQAMKDELEYEQKLKAASDNNVSEES